MQYADAKTILSSYSAKSGWFGCNYNLNLYRGCSHGCIYCDSRSSCYQVEEFDIVKPKKDAISILEKEMISRRNHGIVGFGAMSDSYNPLEEHLLLTRDALKLMDKYHFGVNISTKSTLITRDIDIYQSIASHSPVTAKFTITTAYDKTSKIIEPHASLSSERFAALGQLAKAGVHTGLLMMPILPYITNNIKNILDIVKRASDNGVSFIFPGFGVTLRDNQREYYYNELDKCAPGLRNQYEQRYGAQYSCDIPNAHEVVPLFEAECKKYGIVYRMKDIVEQTTDNYRAEQLSFL